MATSRNTRPRRRRFDDDDWAPRTPLADGEHRTDPADDGGGFATRLSVDDEPDETNWSTYRDASKGPSPVPEWVITDPRAVDDDLGVMKTGKEAEVSLLRRTLDEDGVVTSSLMAVKRYRAAEHRNFHRNAGYLEGRRVRKSREMRAMETRTAFGRELIADQWAIAEFAVLSRLWEVGAAVPYPVQLHGSELMMEFIGSPHGVAAPRLAQLRPSPRETRDLYLQMVEVLGVLAEQGYAHGDLSAYNVLVHDGRLVLIDLPQAVDVVGNPQGFAFLRRDCDNICAWFTAHGHPADPAALHTLLATRAGPLPTP